MSEVILHIGMHKTGTTAVQSAYHGYDDGRTCYADLGYENHSIPLYTIFSGAELNYHIWKRAKLSDDQIRAKKSQLEARLEKVLIYGKRKTLLFSGEDLSALPVEGVEKLASVFQEHGCDVKVLAYVRSPLSFIVSDYQELIKAGQRIERPVPPNFRHRLEKYIRVFGRKNVEVREFSRDKLTGGDILSDFAAATGTIVPSRGHDNNEGLSLEALRVIYILNQFVDSFRDDLALCRAKEACIGDLRNLFPGKTEIPAELIAPLVDAADVRWLAEQTGIDFTDDIKNSTAPFQPDRLSAYVGTPDPETVATLHSVLRSRGVIPDLPLVPHLIIARYLMSFIRN